MKFSIITINYNGKDDLAKTIQSVTSQSCNDYEYIVIDGGSTDGSVDVIKENENFIDFWISEKDKGVYNAMNKGISHAHGDYLIFMNSGDCFHSPTVLLDIIPQLKDNDILIGSCIRTDTMQRFGGLVEGQDITFLTLCKEIVCHQGMFYKREIFDKYKYDETLRLIADWKLNVQAIVFDNCKVKVVDTIVADYDMNGISSTNGQLHLQERKRVMSELLPDRILEDYKNMFSSKELPIVSLLPQLKNSYRIQHYVYKFAKLLLRLKR